MTLGLMIAANRLFNLATRFEGFNVNLSFIYLAPACLVAIFIRNFFGLGTAFLCNLLVALFGAVLIQQSLEFAFVQIVAGTVAVYTQRRIRKREDLLFSVLYIFLGYIFAFLVYSSYSEGGYSKINYFTLLLFVINAVATIIAYNFIYLLERLFGLTSDLTFIELLDTNHPLLKELARKAPGTFHHSLQVANLAEAAVSELGGNELLTHVGALYHDIGKMPQQQFFIENMSEAQKNNSPHQRISDLESARIIIDHVTKGVELAQKHSLPRDIIRFIETHHGTTRVEYFYRNHLKETDANPEDSDSDFRYPGPLPFSKETAVLMIVDSVEAASRAMAQPTPEALKDLVDNIVDYKIREGQLKESNLTFADITIIKRVLLKQLKSIYHARIQYPEEVKK
ncbi:MAG: HDIG domain-containing metalloprotein [Bacteroidota bacterium]